ncbi:hypothetical protein GUITHDRAFT_119817 [Guillardia theta CCMP2712]|uniref:PAS domain-containing protein n=1 Tax=Guillardia theta (strain CCMP2712) TaxID=905079 RepID=L1ID43_GUITC|nr:hypothetical protein GUITHDRAFT_119817 [Guillardia theta CCMP2712]EKX34017.1 hypothetical protein GUITHDRAFT_119817 [Guillardia theta CCMP2712]|eukprot:XP_005820997.1 hypothetical protein GUITHDRAFT_119817 [Guillardia theta CCMP2712]
MAMCKQNGFNAYVPLAALPPPLPAICVLVDVRARSRVLLASPQWISLFGFKLDSDVVGHSLSDLLPDLPVLHRLVKEGSMGYAREGYVRLGQQGSFRVSCRPVGGDMEDGDPVGCVLGFRRTRAEEFERGMLETREAVVLVGADAGLTILGYNQEALRCVGREGELNGSVTELTEEKEDGERLAEVCRRRLREEEGAEEATWETVWVGRSRVKVYPVALYSGSRGRLCGVLLYMREDKGICRRTSSIANVCEAKWEVREDRSSVRGGGGRQGRQVVVTPVKWYMLHALGVVLILLGACLLVSFEQEGQDEGRVHLCLY